MESAIETIGILLKKANTAEDIFGIVSSEARANFLRIAGMLNPDKYKDAPSKETANALLGKILKKWRDAQKKIKSGTYGTTRTKANSSEKKEKDIRKAPIDEKTAKKNIGSYRIKFSDGTRQTFDSRESLEKALQTLGKNHQISPQTMAKIKDKLQRG